MKRQGYLKFNDACLQFEQDQTDTVRLFAPGNPLDFEFGKLVNMWMDGDRYGPLLVFKNDYRDNYRIVRFLKTHKVIAENEEIAAKDMLILKPLEIIYHE